MNRNLLISFLLLVVAGALFRVMGYAPQIAMALFAGAVIKDKKWAFIFPLLSMFLSDVLYEILYRNGLIQYSGFYVGQWLNYIAYASVIFVGFLIKKINIPNVLFGALAAPTLFFLISNFFVWAGNSGTRGLNRPKTLEGLFMCYWDGLPFYGSSILPCLVFSALLFGSYALLRKRETSVQLA